ncbi:MAG: FtsW/RodA/SpoVE family cell cycle protein [Lachnospiraceae bacterium]|nr:FtsW/RodA/SpoVE family cell cycle protein [Lachnospiraceae bacterium]
MVQYISAFSKYFIVFFMIVYTMTGFLVFSHKDEHSRKNLYGLQVVLIVLMHFSCFLSICLKTGDIKYLFYYAAFQVSMILFMEIFPMIYERINRLIINNVCMLTSIGLVMLARLDFDKALKQFIIVMISLVIGGFIPFIMKKINRIPNIPYFYGGVGIFLLALVSLIGRIANGSRLAIFIFGVSFQASEFVKIIFVICLAGILYNGTEIRNLLIATAFAAAHVLILALSNDLGAALILFVTFVLMVFIATGNFFYLAVGVGTGAGISVLAYNLFRHVQVRVQAFIDPFSVIDNEGYQITQSLFAIGSGSWFGLGLFDGTPETIPYVETDFIYSAIAQEFGIVFAICLILICLSCFIMFINISFKLSDDFYRYIAVGLGFTYVFQVFLTVGGGTRFIPLAGVTLPLVSYGGSSVMATVFTFMIIEGLYTVRDSGNFSFKNKAKERKLNSQFNILMGLVYLFILLFTALSVYLSVYVSTHKEEMINNPYNPRQEALIRQSVRGPIYSRDMEILASTSFKTGEEVRTYPFHNIFSHVVGYSSNGKSGIEAVANYYLINSNQPMTERIAADLSGDKYLGDGVVTTLDTELQKSAYTAIGSYNGAAVVSNPKTGEILALVSKPDFDPNEITEIWDDLMEDEESSVLLNRATNGLYPPGSTFKIVTLFEYIHENPENYNDYSFNCVGELKVDDGKIICYNHDVHGSVDLKKSLAISCNSSFGNLGLSLDRNKFSETLREFMFNEELPVSFGALSSSIVVNEDMTDRDMALTAFGQGKTLMTPLHLNMITSAIANKGVVMKPYIISSVVNSMLNPVKTFGESEYRRIMTEEEAAVLTDMLEGVVNSGTAKKLKTDKYTVAGKTGSAEYSDYTTSTHSWFTGFAPAEDPEICVTIILENAGTSGLHAVPMAKKIFDTYFRRYDNGEVEPEQ